MTIDYQNEPIFINSLLWDLVESNETFIMNLGIFVSFEKALGEAFRIASDGIEDNAIITPLYDLEGDGGFGFSVKNKNGEIITNYYILNVSYEGDIISNQ